MRHPDGGEAAARAGGAVREEVVACRFWCRWRCLDVCGRDPAAELAAERPAGRGSSGPACSASSSPVRGGPNARRHLGRLGLADLVARGAAWPGRCPTAVPGRRTERRGHRLDRLRQRAADVPARPQCATPIARFTGSTSTTGAQSATRIVSATPGRFVIMASVAGNACRRVRRRRRGRDRRCAASTTATRSCCWSATVSRPTPSAAPADAGSPAPPHGRPRRDPRG